MKTIKELEKEIEHFHNTDPFKCDCNICNEAWNGENINLEKIETLKEVSELIDELESAEILEAPPRKETIELIDRIELKQKIEGDK